MLVSAAYVSVLSLAFCLPLVLASPAWRIINGTEANKFEFKSMVSISRYFSHKCGGTLINADTVLTAAHCFSSARPLQLRVHINAHNLRNAPRERQVVGVARIIKHPQWDRNELFYDYLLLKLDRSVRESDTVEYSPLPPSTSEIAKPGDDCEVVGWGTTNPNGRGSASPKLMKGKMKIMAQDRCKLIFDDIDRKAHLCAESAYISTTACKGDSGGPLFCRSKADDQTYQVGVVSYGKVPCGQPGIPIVFARVSSVMDWINSHL